jgi:ribosomal protein S18 acetylase RimI-like enzyme
VIVAPEARGLGIGKRLVQECIAFARAKGYRKLVLWTQANLTAARGIYRKAGFERVKSEVHRSFGPKVTGEYWQLLLRP